MYKVNWLEGYYTLHCYKRIIGRKDSTEVIHELQEIIRHKDEIDTLKMDFTECSFISPASIGLICSVLKLLQKTEELNSIDIIESRYDINSYMSRMNLFSELGIDRVERFRRHNPNGRFIPLTKVESEENFRIIQDIMDMIEANFALSRELFLCLDWCFNEIVDNIEVHASSPIDGYVIGQNYQHRLEITIIDCGISIPSRMRESEEYEFLSDEETLEYAIQQGVSSAIGQGNGLYYSSRFIENNQGRMIIHSNRARMRVEGGESYSEILDLNWPGTVVHLEINKNSSVDPEYIFEESIPIDIQDRLDGFELW
ncbi:MAG: Uncharacterized protein AWU54_1470 [Candidatus Frackibacter sp. T328-2]|nr:MAG: Uncharacterized protein AWU54_1470 [Candidatus Frackibacter sp. T328-2]